MPAHRMVVKIAQSISAAGEGRLGLEGLDAGLEIADLLHESNRLRIEFFLDRRRR